jgi:ABC-type multidrug transport system fused ATPase/permease subunit
VLIVWYGARLVAAQAMTAGTLVAFIAYMELLSEPVSRAGRFYQHIQVCRGVLARLVEFLGDMRPRAATRGGARPRGPMTVRFEHVSFTYPGTGRRAIDGVTFETGPGILLAIAGRNGAGKSTLVDLLLGFWRPDGGRIVVGRHELDAWDQEFWRATIGGIPQDVFLFHASLADNIAYGRLDASRADIEHAAASAGLAPLLRRLPDGLETPVGDRGQRLSGGERQRVALARLLLKNPQIIVFDEPTSGLDGEAVRDLYKTLVELSRARTVIVIAHRPDALELATRVVLLDGGRIVAAGRHAELLSTNALYGSLTKSAPAVREA